MINKYAIEGYLIEEITFNRKKLVSSDIIGTSAPSIYDSLATIVSSTYINIILYF